MRTDDKHRKTDSQEKMSQTEIKNEVHREMQTQEEWQRLTAMRQEAGIRNLANFNPRFCASKKKDFADKLRKPNKVS